MMSRIAFTLGFSLAAMTAAAEETLLMGCTFKQGAATVAVTIEDGVVSYRFGRTGQTPELTLSESVEDVEYQPWPGAGSSIWEAISFSNGAHRYEVGMSLPRDPENTNIYGGVTVFHHDDEIAYLTCDSGSGQFLFDNRIESAKAAAGLCNQRGERTWAPCAD
jgi:hypothetical protein